MAISQGSTLLVNYGVLVESSEPQPSLGKTDQPYLIFSSKETWVVGGNNTLFLQINQTWLGSWDHLAFWGVFFPNSDRSLEGGIQKAGDEPPRGSMLRPMEGGKLNSRYLLPVRAPLPGGGHGSPQGEVLPGRRPHPRSKGGIRTSPDDRRQDFGARRIRSALWRRLG